MRYGEVGGVGRSSGRGSKKACISLALISTLLLIAAVVLLAVLIPRSNDKHGDGSSSSSVAAFSQLCANTTNPPLCDAVFASANTTASSPQALLEILILAVSQALSMSADLVNKTSANPVLYNTTSAALRDCAEVLSMSEAHLVSSMQQLRNLSVSSLEDDADTMLTYLSAAATSYQTCLDGLLEAANPPGFNASQGLVMPTDPISTGNSTSLTSDLYSIALYFASYISQIVADVPSLAKLKALGLGSHSRRLLQEDENVDLEEIQFPTWMEQGRRRQLLQLPGNHTKPDVVVSKDGSGDYTSVQKAVDDAPSGKDHPYIIFIAAGIYREQVVIPKDKQNLVFLGAGIDKTIITWGASVGGGNTTFLSATLAVNGFGFIGINFTVANSAGAFKFQAVALRVSADQTAFYLVKIAAFQDTLYAHSLRQFYRECIIVGTVDFTFGNAAAVFQKCVIRPTVGILGQQNTITAQGRTDKSMNTGFSFQGCTVAPSKALAKQLANFKTYLGRPWKLYSRTVFMGSTLNSFIDPAGWLPWNGTFALDTLYYGEYRNKGPGAGIKQRVPWSSQLTTKQTKKFLIKKLIQGRLWLPNTGVTFTNGIGP